MAVVTMDAGLNSTSVSPPTAEDQVNSFLWMVFIVAYVVVVITTICGNVIVIAAYATNEFVRASVTNILILNLSFSDIIVGSVVMLCDCLTLALGYWPFGDGFCAMWQATHYFAIYMSVVTIIVISLDRLWLISDVIRYKRLMTHRLAGFVLLGVWIYTILYAALYSATTEDIRSPSTRRGGEATCLVASQNGENALPSIVLENLDFALSITLLIGINASVAYKAYKKLNNSDLERSHPTPQLNDKNEERGSDNFSGLSISENVETGVTNTAYAEDTVDGCQPKANGTRRQQYVSGGKTLASKQIAKNALKKRAGTKRRRDTSKQVDYKTVTKNLFILTGVYVACWLPFHILVIGDTFRILEVRAITWEALQRLIWFNSMLNPFLYAKMNLRFRLGMLKVICFKRDIQSKINRLKANMA